MTKNLNNQNILDKNELLTRLRAFPEDEFIVAFYINRTAVSQDEWMEPFASCLNRHGMTTIGIIAKESDGKCALNSPHLLAAIPAGDIKFLERINIFIISDLDFETEYPQRSKVLASPHGLITAQEGGTAHGLCYQLQNLAAMDGWLASFPMNQPCQDAVRSLWTGFVNPDICRRKQSDFSFIPFGYPRLVSLSDLLAKSSHLRDSIVYAPIKKNTAPQAGGNRLEKFTIPAIEAILLAAPGHKVIFRPYKSDLESREVKNIVSAFMGEARFILDEKSGRLSSFSRAAALVTDLSHIAKSFAFTTLRPAVYFRPWLSKSRHLPREWDGGFFAYTAEDLAAVINQSLEYGPQLRNRIETGRKSQIISPENAFSSLPGMLRDFYNNKTNPGWLTIPRNNASLYKTDETLVREIAALHPPAIPCASAAAFIYHNPANPLLAAFALHSGARYLPKRQMFHSVDESAGKLLGVNLSGLCYMDVPPDHIRRLYSRAIFQYDEEGNMEGAALATSLLAEFNAWIDGKKD